MTSLTCITLRQTPAQDVTALRRLVASCLGEAAAANGTSTSAWLEHVARLQDSVTRLDRLRAADAPASTRAAARQDAALAMARTMQVHNDARQLLHRALASAPYAELQAVHAEQTRANDDVIDPWLGRAISESVSDILDAREVPAEMCSAA